MGKNSCSNGRRNHTKMYLSDFEQLLCFDPLAHLFDNAAQNLMKHILFPKPLKLNKVLCTRYNTVLKTDFKPLL